jgi:Ca2+-binding EF-hand superfamily protein
MEKTIHKEDVQNIAKSLDITITDDTINWVLRSYNGWQNNYPTLDKKEVIKSMLNLDKSHRELKRR